MRKSRPPNVRPDPEFEQMLNDVYDRTDIKQPKFDFARLFPQQKIDPDDQARDKDKRKNMDPRAVAKNQHRASSQFQHNYTTERGEKQRNAAEKSKVKVIE